ncbi:hypothetical protein DCS_04606 [Drechmeria coniospora]|uniref:Something about silencing protein 4 domain-containing protein n=1 Tax=Drechmeria coniospora TaxID=98403 RepID=A0A151GKF9_DRECN|nr:hypothetical protein DCS_04606 [Drechmeria coniospora]KYK57595.1 hypothetical protein DCS_04606 [Drechmeria coniospora]ODA79485.1 hypothetical protein RJ55_05078 [Drechmeria coniospora]
MASVTRSTRRAEGLHQPHRGLPVGGPLTRSGLATPTLYRSDGLQKRAIESVDVEIDAFKAKRTRIAVEILPKAHPDDGVRFKVPPSLRQQQQQRQQLQPHQHQHQQLPQQQRTNTIRPSSRRQPIPTTTLTEADTNLTKHQTKVIKGIKHELDQLQPQTVEIKYHDRKLRSREATRFKSELSAYFPDYDEVIGNDPKEQHLLNVETPIVIVDTNPRGAAKLLLHHHQPSQSLGFPVRGYGDLLYTDVLDAQRIDFGFLETQQNSKNVQDPLPDSLFQPIHRRAQRLERSIRNSEKGRAQHEKDQIVRLLEGLQGHDWLRIMGVSGITETKKKTFEPARAYFTKGCQAILDKFKSWNLEEKKRKQKRGRAVAEQEQAAEEQGMTEQYQENGVEDEAEDGRDREGSVDSSTSQDDASEASSPAKQLRQEAMARSRMAASKRPRASTRPTPPRPSEPPREFKSFFRKRHEREAALNRNRRTGRKVLAWGLPLPEFDEADYVLASRYRDEETLNVRARKKRRDKRGTRS